MNNIQEFRKRNNLKFRAQKFLYQITLAFGFDILYDFTLLQI